MTNWKCILERGRDFTGVLWCSERPILLLYYSYTFYYPEAVFLWGMKAEVKGQKFTLTQKAEITRESLDSLESYEILTLFLAHRNSAVSVYIHLLDFLGYCYIWERLWIFELARESRSKSASTLHWVNPHCSHLITRSFESISNNQQRLGIYVMSR